MCVTEREAGKNGEGQKGKTMAIERKMYREREREREEEGNRPKERKQIVGEKKKGGCVRCCSAL